MVTFTESRLTPRGDRLGGVFDDDSVLLRLDAEHHRAADESQANLSLISGDPLEQDMLVETRAWEL